MVELAKADVAIVTGGANGFNRIFVQPEINAYAELRGKTVVVDAPNTAFALLLYKVLKDNGLNKGDYVVKPSEARRAARGHDPKTKRIPPPACSIRRLRSAQRRRIEGHGRGGEGDRRLSVRRRVSSCANGRRPTATRSCAISAPVSKAAAGRSTPPNKAESHRAARRSSQARAAGRGAILRGGDDPAEGIAKDAKLDMDGFKNVLKLRAEIEGQWAAVRRHPRNISICRITIAPWRASDDGPSLARRAVAKARSR